MQESLNIKNLILINTESSVITANQMNHSIIIEELNYGRKTITFRNIRGDLQSKYLEFCLRYFNFFKINESNFIINLFLNNLKLNNQVNNSSNIIAANSLALRYFKPIIKFTLELSNSINKKYTRQAFSINSFLNNDQIIKKIKIKSLNFLSTTITISPILLEFLKEFLNDFKATFIILE